jgi:hypothetical protein
MSIDIMPYQDDRQCSTPKFSSDCLVHRLVGFYKLFSKTLCLHSLSQGLLRCCLFDVQSVETLLKLSYFSSELLLSYTDTTLTTAARSSRWVYKL